MNTHDNQFQEMQDKIRSQIEADFPIEVHIPGWSPVGFEEGLHWLRATIYEGYYVKCQVITKSRVNIVSLLKWEFGEEEPEF